MILHVTCDISVTWLRCHMTRVRDNSRINVYSISIVAFRCYAFVIFCWIIILWKRIIRLRDDPADQLTRKSEIPSVGETEIFDQNDLPFDRPVDTHVMILFCIEPLQHLGKVTFQKWPFLTMRWRFNDPNSTREWNLWWLSKISQFWILKFQFQKVKTPFFDTE